LDAIISTSEPIRVLAEGYGGDMGQAKGRLVWKDAAIFSSATSRQPRIKYRQAGRFGVQGSTTAPTV